MYANLPIHPNYNLTLAQCILCGRLFPTISVYFSSHFSSLGMISSLVMDRVTEIWAFGFIEASWVELGSFFANVFLHFRLLFDDSSMLENSSNRAKI